MVKMVSEKFGNEIGSVATVQYFFLRFISPAIIRLAKNEEFLASMEYVRHSDSSSSESLDSREIEIGTKSTNKQNIATKSLLSVTKLVQSVVNQAMPQGHMCFDGVDSLLNLCAEKMGEFISNLRYPTKTKNLPRDNSLDVQLCHLFTWLHQQKSSRQRDISETEELLVDSIDFNPFPNTLKNYFKFQELSFHFPHKYFVFKYCRKILSNLPLHQWTLFEVGLWLANCGVSNCFSHFEKHQISGRSLSLLTSDDLRETNIKVGDRVRILKALDLLKQRN